MVKAHHEFRDAVHVFVHADDDERSIIDSRPVQRLREIHQLAMGYMVYPGASHRRFEHSLGVMELAGRVFDVVTDTANVHPRISELIPEMRRKDELGYWRRAVRMAALCHDIGHLPFSHAAEAELLPKGWNHERLTVEHIRSPAMEALWRKMTPPLRSEDVAKLAVGKKELPDEEFTYWQAVLSEIIVNDALGVDRMDYLLRDSLHAGHPSGRIDHFRLIDTLRILPDPGSSEPQLGVESGGIHSAEALLIGRYFMFRQVYHHPVRIIYDVHLKDYLRETLPDRKFPIRLASHLNWTDTRVLAMMTRAARRKEAKGHEAAARILDRNHFKVLWEWNPADLKVSLTPGDSIEAAAKAKFGNKSVRRSSGTPSRPFVDFPVLLRDNRVESAQVISSVIINLPLPVFDFVFVAPELRRKAAEWLSKERDDILSRQPSEEN